MIRINLLPFRSIQKRENVRRQVSIFLLTLLLVVVALVGFHMNMSSKAGDLEAKLQASKTELARYQKKAMEVSQLEASLAALNEKLGTIDKLVGARELPVRLLSDMTQLVVEKRMWLTELMDTDTDLTLKGISVDSTTVADFQKRLEKYGMYPEVELVHVKHSDKQETMDLKVFEIKCHKEVVVTEEEKEAKKP